LVNIQNRGYVYSGGIILKLLLLLFLTNICFAQEQIVDFEEKSLPVLNEELRQIGNDIENGDLWEESDSVLQLKTAANIDFQQEESKQFVIENRTDDPSSPVTGQIWFRTDL